MTKRKEHLEMALSEAIRILQTTSLTSKEREALTREANLITSKLEELAA